MDFIEHTLGVKILKNFVAIEPCNPFGDLSKYDFIYTDYVSSDYNGNTSYGSKIKVVGDKQSYFVINGWKLLKLSFPGNWFGNWIYYELEDRFGRKQQNTVSGINAVYPSSYNHLIQEGLLDILSFTHNNPCVEFKEIMDGLEPVYGDLNLEEFHELIESVDAYIDKYRDLKENLTEDELNTFSDKLREAVSDNISKIFGLSIRIE